MNPKSLLLTWIKKIEIMKFLKGVWKFINSKIFGYIMIIVIAIFLVGTCSRVSNLKEEAEIKDQNISALADSIKTIKTANGELQASRDAYMASAKELEQYNKELSDDVKKQKGNVVTLNKIVFNLEQDKAELEKWKAENQPKPNPPSQETDSTWKVPWVARYVYDSTNFDSYAGTTIIGLRGPYDLSKVSVFHNGTDLTYRNSQIGLIWGQKWEGKGKNKRLRVYAQTAHPAFKAKLLEGVYVDYPEKRHWFTGFGVGPTLNLGYDFLNNQPAVVVGIGIHYSIYSW